MRVNDAFRSAAVFMLLFSALCHNALGQEYSTDTIWIEDVIVTASKFLRTEGNITQKIDVISSRDVSSAILGNNNISEALVQTPGASVSALSRNDANWGTYAGIGPKYSTFMLTGLPLDAFVDPMSLDLSAIDHIEVQRGPASVMYPNYLSQDFAGNQSPLAGTVNLLYKEWIDLQETRFSVSYGTYNTLNSRVYQQGYTENLHYFGGITYEISDYTNYGTTDSWLNMKDNPSSKQSMSS